MKKKVLVSMLTIFLITLVDDMFIAFGLANSIHPQTYLFFFVALPLFLFLIAPYASLIPGGGVLMNFRLWFLSFSVGGGLMFALIYYIWPIYAGAI